MYITCINILMENPFYVGFCVEICSTLKLCGKDTVEPKVFFTICFMICMMMLNDVYDNQEDRL